MNYTIEEYLLNEHNAASKARKDVSHFVLQSGFRSLFRNDKSRMCHRKFNKALLTVGLIVKLFKLKRTDILFVQTSLNVLRYILRIKAIRKFKIIYLIHDLYCLRYNTAKSINEHSAEIGKDINLVSKCDYVIAHNDIMVERLKAFGCTSRVVSLGIFDYDCRFPERTRRLLPNEEAKITFAGYLAKANFLKKLDQRAKRPYPLIIYGAPEIPLTHSVYKCCIDADELPNRIEGHFGLIWEGNYEADECDNYICVNNPHKLSMYIVAGLPVIVWNKSAAASFVKSNDIGVTINSLDELDILVKSISPDEYAKMTARCMEIRKKLIKGTYLQNALRTILSNYNLGKNETI